MSSISQREFAKEIGRSRAWVQGKIAEGVFEKNADGSLNHEKALEAFYEHERAKGAKFPDLKSSVNLSEALKKAQLATQVATAKLRDLEFKQKSGELVAVEEVEADAMQVAAKLRAFCMSAPTRFSGLLEGRSQRECEAVLRKLFSELLISIHDGRFFDDDDFKLNLEESS